MFRIRFVLVILALISCEREAVNIKADSVSDLILLNNDSFNLYDNNLDIIKNDNFPEDYFSSIILNTKYFRKKISNKSFTHFHHDFSIGTKFNEEYNDFGEVFLDTAKLVTYDSLNAGKFTNYNYQYRGSDFRLHVLPQKLIHNSYTKINIKVRNSSIFNDQDIPFNIVDGIKPTQKAIPQTIYTNTDLIFKINRKLDPRSSIISILYEKKGNHPESEKYVYSNFTALYFTGQFNIPKDFLNDIYNKRKKDTEIILFIGEKIRLPDFEFNLRSGQKINIPSGRINRIIYTLEIDKIETNA